MLPAVPSVPSEEATPDGVFVFAGSSSDAAGAGAGAPLDDMYVLAAAHNRMNSFMTAGLTPDARMPGLLEEGCLHAYASYMRATQTICNTARQYHFITSVSLLRRTGKSGGSARNSCQAGASLLTA